MPQRPPVSQLLIYAAGQLGWSLAAFGAANLLIYFYLPAETEAGSNFPAYIYTGAILGIATLIGFINAGGRLFDAITDPLIAAWSDGRPRAGGKRTRVMRMAALPFALLSLLIFIPPVAELSNWNAAWLVITVFLFYLCFTIYTIPYTALISELGHHPDDRMKISTYISVTWALGFVIGNSAYAVQGMFEASHSSSVAFQWTMGIFAAISLVFMLIPAFFLREETYALQEDSTTRLPGREALREVLQNRGFVTFITSDLLYWLALTFIQQGISFYVILLFGYPKESATEFMTISFFFSFALYYPINLLVNRFGKRPLVLAAFLCLGLVFLLTALLPQLPLDVQVWFYLLALLSAFPMATFGIVPNALIADFIHEHEATTGQQQAGMFYAVRNFMMKVGITLASLLFPSFLLLGKSVDNPTGAVMSAWAALFFCLLGWWVFRKVPLQRS